jgi:hypothetical protein
MSRIALLACLLACNSKSSPPAAPAGSAATPATTPTPPTKIKPACELLTVDEVGKIAGSDVKIDPSQSGPTDEGKIDHCVYMHGQDTVVYLTEDAKLPWDSVKFGAFDSTKEPVAVEGLGDEALYAEFKNGYGSNLIVRRGGLSLVFSGNQRRDAYVAMAKLVIPRL